jgi:hypothetical protein
MKDEISIEKEYLEKKLASKKKRPKNGKCLLCMHYDVVNFECNYWKEKLKLDEYPTDPMDSCDEFERASAKKLLEGASLKVDIGID